MTNFRLSMMDLQSGHPSNPGFPGWSFTYAHACAKAPLVAAQRADALPAYRVSTAVNSVKNDGPECVEAAA